MTNDSSKLRKKEEERLWAIRKGFANYEKDKKALSMRLEDIKTIKGLVYQLTKL